ncbi:helix-turn-helix domain-containing protein [Dankookia sp. GCM10030260]|uniref:helix-turn-helix domain-containing protein n=1 Tax=Dankookia sp. GCM10030260 TaxID=3273390 RepID=UPI0036D43A31
MEEEKQGLILSRHFTNAEEFARTIRDSNVEYVPLEAGRYESRIMILQHGSILLQRAADQAHVTRGTIDRHRAALLLPVLQRAPPVVNGRPTEPQDVIIFRPGSELHALAPAAVEWGSLSMPLQEADWLLELGGKPCMGSHADPMRLLPPEIAASIRQTFSTATDPAWNASGGSEFPAADTGLRRGLHELVIEAFSKAEQLSLPGRATRDAIRLVGTVEEYLHAAVARPIYTDALCLALAVSPRKLHHAFVAVCGLSPHVYLKRRRLLMVRQALLASCPKASLVKSVALAHGFWHLGNFAHDYREQFGESPSETLAFAGAATVLSTGQSPPDGPGRAALRDRFRHSAGVSPNRAR